MGNRRPSLVLCTANEVHYAGSLQQLHAAVSQVWLSEPVLYAGGFRRLARKEGGGVTRLSWMDFRSTLCLPGRLYQTLKIPESRSCSGSAPKSNGLLLVVTSQNSSTISRVIGKIRKISHPATEKIFI